MTLIELLVVISVIGILLALTLPAVSAAREAARRTHCSNNLRQIGLGLHAYHDSLKSFPSGYFADLTVAKDQKCWSWAFVLQPFLEQNSLAQQLEGGRRSLEIISTDAKKVDFLKTPIKAFLCPSDTSDQIAHRYRSIYVNTSGNPLPITSFSPNVNQQLLHVGVSPNVTSLRLAKSNYVASHGSNWEPARNDWDKKDLMGNGLFGRNTAVTFSSIHDGTSNTIAIGERSLKNYAAVWAGSNSAQSCGFNGNQMILGTTFYPLNDPPVSLNIDCDGRGAANFSSYHPRGANFAFADGATQFLSENISATLYQNYAQRNDGKSAAKH